MKSTPRFARLLAVFLLAAVGEATEVPRRTPSRGPPYGKSQVLRCRATGDEDGCGNHRGGEDEAR